MNDTALLFTACLCLWMIGSAAVVVSACIGKSRFSQEQEQEKAHTERAGDQ